MSLEWINVVDADGPANFDVLTVLKFQNDHIQLAICSYNDEDLHWYLQQMPGDNRKPTRVADVYAKVVKWSNLPQNI